MTVEEMQDACSALTRAESALRCLKGMEYDVMERCQIDSLTPCDMAEIRELIAWMIENKSAVLGAVTAAVMAQRARVEEGLARGGQPDLEEAAERDESGAQIGEADDPKIR